MGGHSESYNGSSAQAGGNERLEASINSPADKHETNYQNEATATSGKSSVYAGLGWLDRLLVLWILLAIIIGIVLGNFVDGIGPALQRGKFVDVSIPIGESVDTPSVRVALTPQQLWDCWS